MWKSTDGFANGAFHVISTVKICQYLLCTLLCFVKYTPEISDVECMECSLPEEGVTLSQHLVDQLKSTYKIKS